MINWAEYFNRIFCIFHLPYRERMSRLKNELQRVGILDSGIFEWRFTTPSAYDKAILDSLEDRTRIDQVGYVNQQLELQRILKESQLQGYKRILILEDDVAFLRDEKQIERLLKNLPEGYDIIQCDKGVYQKDIPIWQSLLETKQINESYVDSTNVRLGASGANIFTQTGISAAINVLDHQLVGGDHIMALAKCKCATAINNLCIQVFFKTAANLKYGGVQKCHSIYKGLGILYDLYGIPPGYSYDTLYVPSDMNDNEMMKSDKRITSIKVSEMWAPFDYVGIVCYTGYQDRADLLQDELKRVGLEEKAHFHWDFPSVFRDCLFKHIGKTSFCSQGGCFYMALMHYNVVKTAYELGAESVLVLEDDIRFLKDVKVIGKILSTIPDRWDMLMLDRSKPGDCDIDTWLTDLKHHENTNWCRLEHATSTGAYAFSRRGMARYIDLVEQSVRANLVWHPDYYFSPHNGKDFWGMGYRRFVSTPSVAVQVPCGANGCHCNLDAYWNNNEKAGNHKAMYNISDMAVSKYNYLSKLYNYIDHQERELREGKCLFEKKDLLIASIGLKDRMNDNREKPARVYVWGNGATVVNISLLQRAITDKAQVVLSEDGFIRSVDTWCGGALHKYKASHSVIFDTKAYYFDAIRISLLEEMLNDRNLEISLENQKEAHRLIEKIVKNKISKYNHQPIYTPTIGREGASKVLVVDQSYGDFSIKIGLADESTFEKMLQTAIDENPEADILVKTHPDTLAGKKAEKKGYYQDLKEQSNIHKVTFPINPYSLMEICDKVYVCSSQFGIEALMAGKEVHVFGMPFYAGWGLTIDAQHLDRRTNKRSLEELFYIFYCLYTHWVDPEKMCETTIDVVIDKMIELREEYQKNYHKASIVSRTQNSADDGFGYQNPFIRTSSIRIPTTSITTRSIPSILPRISPGSGIRHM